MGEKKGGKEKGNKKSGKRKQVKRNGGNEKVNTERGNTEKVKRKRGKGTGEQGKRDGRETVGVPARYGDMHTHLVLYSEHT